MAVRKLALLVVSVVSAAAVMGSPSAGAETLSPEARLRKMSFLLRGIAPADQEFAAVSQLDASAQQAFFAAKAKSYLASDLGADKLSDRLFEVLRFDLPERNLLLRDETYRNNSREGVDLSNGFDSSMTSLKNVVSAQISKGKSWDDILTSSDVMFLPIAGQALSEFSQQATEIRASLEKLKAQGLPVDTQEQIKSALDIVAGIAPAPEGIVFESFSASKPTDNFSRAVGAARKAAPVVIDLIREYLKEFANEFETQLKNRQTTQGEEKGLVAYFQSEGPIYFDYVLSMNDNKTKIGDAKIQKVRCLLNAVAMNQNRAARYPNEKCSAGDFGSPLLDSRTVAWLLAIDLSKPGQSEVAVDYLVKRARTPEMMDEILSGNPREEIFSVPSIVSTPEFRERYKKTRYSRAAAFFRTYFCDDMQPVITIDNSKKTAEALKGLAFDTPADAQAHSEVMAMITPNVLPEAMKPNSASVVTQPQIEAATQGNEHFKPECIACHRKLDPAQELIAGKTDFSTKRIEVVYDHADGTEKRVEIKDYSELGKIVVQQEQYVRCQSERMWAWTVGEDVTLDANRRAQLTSLYTELQARPREIMAALVQRPEYVSDDSFTQAPTFSTVAPLLNRCNSCHTEEEDVPSFTTFPIEGEDHARWIVKIAKSVALGKGGVGAKMPKKNAGWTLTEADRVALGRWIYHGARNDAGEATIEESDRNKILKDASETFIKAISSERAPVASFRPTWRRYMENYDLLNVLAQKFPQSYGKCASAVDSKMRGALGFKDKASGAPNSLTPGITMVDWLNKCLFAVASAEARTLKGDTVYGVNVGDVSASWMQVDQAKRQAIVATLATSIIGAKVLMNEDLEDLQATVHDTMNDMSQEKPNLSVADAVGYAIFTVLNDERFLTY